MTLQGTKRDREKNTAAVFECKPCKLSITDTIRDDLDDRTLQ
jgi:hypothetical protein